MFNFLAGPGMMGGQYGGEYGSQFGGMMNGYGFGGIGPFNLPFPLILIILLACFIFWVWMLADMIERPVKNKTMWAILFVFTHIIGALIYCFTARKTTPKHGHQKS